MVPGVFEAFEYVHILSRVDFPAAGTAEDGLRDTGAVQRDVPGSHRKGPVVFQQYDALLGNAPCQVAVVPLPLVFGGRCTCISLYFHIAIPPCPDSSYP